MKGVSPVGGSRRTFLALTHLPSPRMNECLRTHAAFAQIDVERAHAQHFEYRRALERAGADVEVLEANDAHPDAVFVEDTAIVLDEVAIIASMSEASRRDEPAAIERELRRHRSVARVALPATLEGGDVLRVGRRLLVGRSARTNAAGIAALRAAASPYGYDVVEVDVRGCLHLKTACTALPDGTLLVSPAFVPDLATLGADVVLVDEDEPLAANVVVVGEAVVTSAAFPNTAAKIRSHAREVHRVDLSEFAKADGSATCLSLVFAAS